MLEEMVRDHEVHGRVGNARKPLSVVDHVDRHERLPAQLRILPLELGNGHAVDVADARARGNRERVVQRTDLEAVAA
jgi:hypothetical protein